MDLSGNSGCSMQSSSGGDDEFDDSYNSIRGEGDHHQSPILSNSFFNSTNSPNVVGSISTPPPPQQPPPHFLSQQKYFDPPPLHHPSFPQSNDLIWSRTSSCNDHHQQNFTGDFGNLTASKNPSLTDPSPSGHASKSSLGPDRLSGVIKNPKKRSRASRRAPTTVLATDTANFRQMVQEFTGIPDAPFRGSGSSTSPYSRRLDLFSAAATALRSGAGAHFNPLDPLYNPLRPLANKALSPSSLLNSTTMIDSIVPTSTALGASASNNSTNYQLPSVSYQQQQQQQHQQQHHNINPLHISSMSLGNLSGFPSQETQSRVVGDNNDRWTSGETVRNDDGVDENLVTSNFDANNINSNDSQRISGYNLNVSEKGLENTVSNWGR